MTTSVELTNSKLMDAEADRLTVSASLHALGRHGPAIGSATRKLVKAIA